MALKGGFLTKRTRCSILTIRSLSFAIGPRLSSSGKVMRELRVGASKKDYAVVVEKCWKY